MKAAVYERYGPPEVLKVREVPKPEPKDDEVLVAVGATTVTSACGMMRRGDTLMARLVLGLLRPRSRFRILGIEIAGTVARVGRRVTRFRPGDRVFGFTGFLEKILEGHDCPPRSRAPPPPSSSGADTRRFLVLEYK